MNWRRFGSLAASLGLTLAIISLLLLISGRSPLTFFTVLYQGSIGSASGFLLVLSKMSLLILAGLAVVIPYRTGMFNIGGEGQMITGGLAAAVIGAWPLQSLGPLHMIFCLLCGTLVGALWGGLAAWLKNARGIHEVIGTIMLNFIALQIVNELALGPFNAGPGTSRTALMLKSSFMPEMLRLGNSNVTWGIVISILLAIGLHWILYCSWPGFHWRAVGSNPEAAAYSGISVRRARLTAFLIGGGCAGLAGAMQSAGIDHTFYMRFVGGAGFDGIAVAFLALNEPWTVIPSSLAIAVLRAADRALQLDAALPKEFVFMLEGILIVCIAILTPRRNYE